jgi:hypothetical protein
MPDMRTALELPDDLVRLALERAAFEGLSIKALLQKILEQGLRQTLELADDKTSRRQRSRLPVFLTGGPVVPALSNAQLNEILDREDAQHGWPD